MTKLCVVPNCYTRHEKRSMFKVPSNIDQFRKWIAAIPGAETFLKKSHFVCEKHFEDRYILRKWIKYDSNGRIIAQAPYVHPRLDPSAVPSVFDSEGDHRTTAAHSSNSECAVVDHSYWSSNDSVIESSTISIDDAFTAEKCVIPESSGTAADCSTIECTDDFIDKQVEKIVEVDNLLTNAVTIESVEEHGVTEHPITPRAPQSNDCCFEFCQATVSDVSCGIQTLDGTHSVTIPKSWGVERLIGDEKSFVFSHCTTKVENGMRVPIMERSVMINENKELCYFVYDRAIEPQTYNLPRNLDDVQVLPRHLNEFKNLKLCNGLGNTNVHHLSVDKVFKDYVDRYHHINCTLITSNKRCNRCVTLRKNVQKKEARIKSKGSLKRIRKASNPIDERKLTAIRSRSLRQYRQKKNAQKQVTSLQQCLKDQATEMAAIRTDELAERCSKLNVPISQQSVLKEIISAAGKKDGKNRRYGEEWIMLSLLMNIRSPGYYEFLRKNNVLPLPCKRTIRNYFSLIDMKCGFDEDFAKLLTVHFDRKTPLQRNGMLLLDEINLRKSVAVCSKNLTYVGLTDFGRDGPQSNDINDQATHGLVLMFQPLAESYTQPLAVFASKNPVKGDELAKIVVRAISYIETCGAKIHGVIADGAATNAKMWSLLGISGLMDDTKTWFTHPADDERKVFVFSDIPHVIKNIRNRLYNKKELRIESSKNCIRWDFFNSLFDMDVSHPGNARACPKITQRHVVLDNTSKMRVRLATQIFSNSVAQGLRFYLSHNVEGPLKGCEETIDFCKRINDMFDALNRKTPNEGLIPGNKDFKVLEDSFDWLNKWEMALRKGEISANEYLTPETSKGLRISLRSTMDMCRYLIEKYEFKYLLTGKVNQDNLEKFFGTIRQAAGCNDHPSCPTFLQLYKLLSIYSIIKPPKFGNCTVSDQPPPHILISLGELKKMYGEKSEAKSSEYRRQIREKLDEVLREADWGADEIIDSNPDHVYTLSPILDCIIYYVTGYLCKQILKIYSECLTCQEAIKSDSSNLSSLTQFVDMKSRGGLIHANLRFFNLVRHIEASFSKFASRRDVFDCTLEEVLGTYAFTFPCKEHASDILSYAIVYYIRLRMRQNAHQENMKMTKKFVVKKKLSKLTNQ